MARRLAVVLVLLVALILAQDVPNDDVGEVMTCQAGAADPIKTLTKGSFANSSFFECFRSSAQVYTFIDAMAAASPKNTLTKVTVSKTYLNRTIMGYKLTSPKAKGDAIYVHGALHAREWISVMAVVYHLAKQLDGVHDKEYSMYDWYYVPIVNLDGYIQTWTTAERYRRKNMRPVPEGFASVANQEEAGVDLNRNWGPDEYFNLDNVTPTNLTYPGAAPFSEPEVMGIHTWIKEHGEVIGYLDIHSFAGMILTPYGDNNNSLPVPYEERYSTLGKVIREAVFTANNASYVNEPSWKLYMSYGTFIDYIFRTYQKVALTIEIKGDDFVVPSSTIWPHNHEVYTMMQTFASNMPVFYANLPSPSTKTTSASCTLPKWLFAIVLLAFVIH